MSARIAIVSTRDLDVMDVDEELLFPLLPEAELAHWDDPNVNWAGYEVAILRSTWNYTEHLDEFLAWATRTSQVTRLVNPVDIVEWNTDKRYLADLAARGIPFVFATGYGEAGGAPGGFDEAPVIRKPYDVTQVAAAVAELLGVSLTRP